MSPAVAVGPDSSRPLLVIVGPTGVGKTALSLALAQHVPLEVVSADSRLFYRGLDIGTAKPTLAERTAVPHHLIDICLPDETLTLGAYQRLAYAAINAIHARQRLPVLVGGTGQYVRAVVEGWGIPAVPPHTALRAQLEALGGDEVVRWLSALDPIAAARIDPRNTRRVIRALEVTLVAGQPISRLQVRQPPPYAIKTIGLKRDRTALYERLDARIDGMLAAGLVAEVEGLVAQGYGPKLPAFSGLGYRQLLPFLAGEKTLEDAISQIKYDTHRFVRQQATWFREDDATIEWYDAAEANIAAMVATVTTWRHLPPASGAPGRSDTHR